MKKIFLLIIAIFIYYFSISQEIGVNIGNIAPEIKLPTPEGDTVKLSSLRGQVVLIDIWASWCGPCRKENPHVVKAYNDYKNKEYTVGKGFTIYGVSIDRDRNSWIKGINDDNLTWTNVSDLNYWNSSIVYLYGIRGIPSNFLIDKDGVIIAKDLRGGALVQTLEKYILVDPIVRFEKALNELTYEYNSMESSDKYSSSKELSKIKKQLDEIKNSINNLKK